MIYYNSRQLSEKLNIGHSKWKRWVREFLPSDPLSGRQSGYARQLNLRDAFKVYLGGHLVSQLKFTIPEAQRILGDLAKWIKQNGFYNLHIDQLAKSANGRSHKLIFIIECQSKGFHYVIRDIQSSDYEADESRKLEAFVETPIGDEKMWPSDNRLQSARVISMTNLCACFVTNLAV